MTRHCPCPHCTSPASSKREDGVIARGLTVEASKLYQLLHIRAMLAEIDARHTR